MDLLNDLLVHSGLRSRVLGQRSLSDSTSLLFPCARSIGFHVVIQGQAFIHHGKNKSPIVLERGEIALMARGHEHVVSTDQKKPSKVMSLNEFSLNSNNSNSSRLTIVSGAYQLWNDPVHPFFNEIPDWFILRQNDLAANDKIHKMIDLLSDEVSSPELGSERLIQSLLDVMFSLILRRVVKETGRNSKTWSHATQNLELRKALELLHGNLAKNWNLEELAKSVGLSRSGFALRFKKLMGDSPLHYLTTIRIQRAMELLTSTDLNVENVANEVGYTDAFTFSKAFKRLTGIPPKEFRARDQLAMNTEWRI